MTGMYQFRLIDLLLMSMLWPPCIAYIYSHLNRDGLDTGNIILAELFISVWIWAGWTLGVKIANGLDYENGWKRMGVVLLGWLFPFAIMGAIIGGSISAISILSLILSRITQPGNTSVLWEMAVIGIPAFTISIFAMITTVRLNRRADKAWAL